MLKGSTSVPRSFNVAEDFSATFFSSFVKTFDDIFVVVEFGVAAIREDQLLGNPFLINKVVKTFYLSHLA